jgi:hypothetical protein
MMSSVDAALVHGWWLRFREALEHAVEQWNAGNPDGPRTIALDAARAGALALSTSRATLTLRLGTDAVTVDTTSQYVSLAPTDAIWFTPASGDVMAWFRAESFAEPDAVAHHILALLLGSSHRESYG